MTGIEILRSRNGNFRFTYILKMNIEKRQYLILFRANRNSLLLIRTHIYELL